MSRTVLITGAFGLVRPRTVRRSAGATAGTLLRRLITTLMRCCRPESKSDGKRD